MGLSIRIDSLSPLPSNAYQYTPLFMDVYLSGDYQNPSNPDQIDLHLTIVTPAGKILRQPGFYLQGSPRQSHWQIRFTPVDTGNYQFTIEARTPGDTVHAKPRIVAVSPSDQDGFVRMLYHHFCFKFDSGRPFKGIGENLGWADDYEFYFKKLNAFGCNFVRIWMCPWQLHLEWKDDGLCNYNQSNATRLDSILSLAEHYQIYIELCLDYHGVVQKEEGYFKEKRWSENPYNQKNGGPCLKEQDFFTVPAAKEYYKKRLRYIMARFGYHPNILAWEFWNEVNLTAGNPPDIIAWHQEMARYVKELDIHRHLLSTSFINEGYPEVWQIPQLDFSQNHYYNSPDITYTLEQSILSHSRTYGKPHVIGEFGVDFRGPSETIRNDPYHIGIHNGLWVGIFAPTPIIPLTWWWDNLIEPNNLYHHFQAVSRFSREIFSDTLPPVIADLKESIIPTSNSQKSLTGQSLTILPSQGWGSAKLSRFDVPPNGQIANENEIPGFIYGEMKKDMGQSIEFSITYLQDGEFSLHIYHVSDTNRVVLSVDQNKMLDKTLFPQPDQPEWKETQYNSECQCYQGLYDQKLTIPIKKGPHRIKIENIGQDWVEVGAYIFSHCGIEKTSALVVKNLKKNTNLYLWIRHPDYEWKKVMFSGLPLPIEGRELTATSMPDGRYRMEWWDTEKGIMVSQEEIMKNNQPEIHIPVPPISRDIAGKLIRIGELPR